MLAFAQKIEGVRRGAHVGRQCVANIRIKVRQTRAIYDHIERSRQAQAQVRRQSETGLAHVAVDHFNSLAEKRRETIAMPLRQLLEHRRFFQRSLVTFHRSRRPVVPYQQINAANLRQIGKQVGQPHFSDEPRRANQQNMFSGQRMADGQRFSPSA